MSTPSALDDHAACFKAVADRRGIETETIPGECWPTKRDDYSWLSVKVGSGLFYYHNQCFFRGRPDGGPGDRINGAAVPLARDKHRAKEILVRSGIPVPPGAVFAAHDLAAALTYAADCPGEICVKPNCGSQGSLVFPMLRSAEEILEACQAVAAAYDEVLVEASVPGEMWRFFYVRPRIVGIKLGRPASVLGDGISSIAALIDAKHAERARRNIIGHIDMPDGHARAFMLKRQGLTLSSIVARDHRVFLHLASNGQMGADSLSRTEALHPAYVPWLERACDAFPGLLIGGLDVAIRNPALPPDPTNFWVLEVNTSPGILPYHHPWEGPPQDVAGAILDFLGRTGED